MTTVFKILLVLQIVLNCKLISLSAVWVSMAWIRLFQIMGKIPQNAQFLVSHG